MKPILFNTDMVRAILDGRKMVTRRVVKPNGIFQGWSILGRDKSMIQTPNGFGFLISNGEKSVETLMYMPYRPGDILYVRETWAKVGDKAYGYKADDIWSVPRWRPSIHMPREAARIFLRVTDVRVERLQDIKERGKFNASAEAEGFCNDINLYDGTGKSATKHFAEAWDSTIKPKDRALYGWAANPWVWVIAFERISKEEAMRA